jgi:hypothetical protein
MNSPEGSWTDLDELVGKLESTPVPDTNSPLRTTLLHADPITRASCMLVEFPPGWKRAAGIYSCAEHAVVLDGEIILDGDLWTKYQGFVVPADRARTETFSPSGALAVAWFGGAPRWTSGAIPHSTPSSEAWVGDSPSGICDELDPVARKWRHCVEAETPSQTGVFMYQWPKP